MAARPKPNSSPILGAGRVPTGCLRPAQAKREGAVAYAAGFEYLSAAFELMKTTSALVRTGRFHGEA